MINRLQIMVDFTIKNTNTVCMQLFHTHQFDLVQDVITVSDPRVVYQLKRVMRARSWQHIVIQDQQTSQTIRYTCQITAIWDISVQARVEDTVVYPHRDDVKQLVVAMSNKWDKMELIVQKATECGVSHITIVPMHRSVITHHNTNKRKRLELIMLEAVEQSWSTQSPVLQWVDHLQDLSNSGTIVNPWEGESLSSIPIKGRRGTLSWQVLVCNMGWQVLEDIARTPQMTVVIWPEGWLDDADIAALSKHGLAMTTISLWSTVLRMETAAIVSSWWMNQS
jgi:16S rRNA (uracil1498-N3)-methyltransferase